MSQRKPSGDRRRLSIAPISIRVVILFNFQLPVFKDQEMLEIHAGGGSRIRTGDILLAKQTLYQLSYTPEV